MVVVLCNCSSDEASGLAHLLVERGLAACVNILPKVRSVYRWKGEVLDEEETTLLIKVASSRVQALSDAIRQAHSYDTPEILVLPVDVERSDPAYVAWVKGL